MAAQSGKVLGTLINDVAFKFDEYACDIMGELPDVSNFEAGGGVVRLAGVVDNEFTFSGPYDVGNMPLTHGTQYNIKARVAPGVFLTMVGRVSNLKPTGKYKDAGRVSVTFQASDGATFCSGIT